MHAYVSVTGIAYDARCGCYLLEAWVGDMGENPIQQWDVCRPRSNWASNLNHPTKRGRTPRAGKEVPIITKGRRVGAAQVPPRTHRRPALASSQCGNTPDECERVSGRKADQDKRSR